MMAIVDTFRRTSVPMKTEQPRMPRAPNVPATLPTTMSMPHYDEEVLRVAQRDYDNKRLIAELEGERDEWRRKALSASEDCKRLEMRLAQDETLHGAEILKLTEQRDRKVDELTQRRDEYRLKLTRFETLISIQGNSLIELANNLARTIQDTLTEIKRDNGREDTAGKTGLAAIAEAVENHESVPRVLTAGPRPPDDESNP